MFKQDALRRAPDLAGRPKSRARPATGKTAQTRSHRKERSDFLRAYSPISFSQALRVILLVLTCLGLSKVSQVAQASPGALGGVTVDRGFFAHFHNIR